MLTVENVISDKLIEIEKAISPLNFANPSLLSGEMSVALFYSCLYSVIGLDVYKEKCTNIIDKAIDFLGESHITNEFCHGYTGVAWGINYIARSGLIDLDPDDFFDEIDEHIYSSSATALKNRFYDYLFGGLGGAVYALDRLPNENALKHLTSVVEILDDIKETDEFGIKWADNFSEKEPGSENLTLYTLGLAHGIPGIISILLRIYEANIHKALCRELIEGAIQWIIHHTNKEKNPYSIYPNCVNDKTTHPASSRLGWCYGDLSIALVMLNAGKILDNETWKSTAISIMDHSVGRRDPLLNQNIDAMFCHGTAGIAYLFRKFYIATANEQYLEEAKYWLDKTLSLSVHKDGPGGYKKFNNQRGVWMTEHGIIDGTIGIGLVLMSFLYEGLDWDKCMLLS